jgi:hypothetical protein
MIQAFFKPTTAEAAQQQALTFAEQSKQAAAEVAAAKARAELHRRGPGRPKRERTVDEALAAAATAVPDKAEADTDSEEEQTAKKPKHTHWFDPALIHDILHAYKLCGFSSRKCVQHLQSKHPALATEAEGRFDKLNESTVRSWFDDEHKLKPQFQALLCGGEYSGPDHASVLSACPAAQQKIQVLLQQMRNDQNAGVNVTIQSIRWVMVAVMTAECPELLLQLKLSKTFISRWCKRQMNWSWRRGTTEAAKLPIDWQQRGIDTAKRIAVNMDTHEVSNPAVHVFLIGLSVVTVL